MKEVYTKFEIMCLKFGYKEPKTGLILKNQGDVGFIWHAFSRPRIFFKISFISPAARNFG